MTAFDVNRISGTLTRKVFKTLFQPRHIPIEKALEQGLIKADTELLIVKLDHESVVSFSKPLMGFYHFAEGYINEKPYMLAFCIICNSGMVLNPEVNGKMLHFEVAGVYNGMVQMVDKETNSYWDHITGECLHGKHKGYQLEVIHSHLVLTAEELAQNYPNAQYGVPNLTFFQRMIAKFQNSNTSVKDKGFLPPFFRKSMLKIDDRLPEMEMGLGLWTKDNIAKYYPIKHLKANKNVLIEEFEGRKLLIYISPTNGTPSAFYIDNTIRAEIQKDRLLLSDGTYIVSGQLFSVTDQPLDEMEQPLQMFSRWYGFVSMFPNCSVYL